MRLSEVDRKLFIQTIRELHVSDKLYEMNQYIQHGNTSTFIHCLAVAYFSYALALRLPFHFDRRCIIRGAMLHDFYLYDWHIPHESHRLHGFHHPRFALTNAKRHYKLTPVEEDIIDKHMWPLTLTKVPIYKESMLVCLVDKVCSLAETFYISPVSRELRHISSRIAPINPTL